MAYTVDLDETAHYEPSHLDVQRLQIQLLLCLALNGLLSFKAYQVHLMTKSAAPENTKSSLPALHFLLKATRCGMSNHQGKNNFNPLFFTVSLLKCFHLNRTTAKNQIDLLLKT